MTILVIEDDPVLADMFQVAFRANDISILEARDRNTALGILKLNADVDCVLMDWYMPGMTCEEFLQQLRRMRPSIPIMLMSAGTKVEQYAKKLGIPFFLKPFDFDDLIERLRVISTRHSGKRATRRLQAVEDREDRKPVQFQAQSKAGA
ncbi:MAG TPA: response regulator [Planctomycetota bacterium]|nr:response regulator [Planctomycetota bacterium]